MTRLAILLAVVALAAAGGAYAVRSTRESPDQATRGLNAALSNLAAAQSRQPAPLNGRSFLEASRDARRP